MSRRPKQLFFLVLPMLLCFGNVTAQSDINNGNDLINHMYERYEGKWYKELTFKQRTITYQNREPVKEEIWYEAIEMPTGLVIKFRELEGDNGIVFKNDTMTIFKNGSQVNQRRLVHELLVLGFSVYFDPPETTQSKLTEVGIDLRHFTKEEVNGKTYFVVGDPAKKQFWIEAENLLFTKIETHNADGSLFKTEFNEYQKLNEGWIAPIVVFYKDDEVITKEEYFDIEVPKTLPKDLFDLSKFSEVSW